MAITTWLNSNEEDAYREVQDSELNELFQEVQDSMRGIFLLQETTFRQRVSWFKRKYVKVYTLYKKLSPPEYQVINFHLDHTWSINTSVPKSIIMAYFYGVLAGKNV